jgi:hypothetical protein
MDLVPLFTTLKKEKKKMGYQEFNLFSKLKQEKILGYLGDKKLIAFDTFFRRSSRESQ